MAAGRHRLDSVHCHVDGGLFRAEHKDGATCIQHGNHPGELVIVKRPRVGARSQHPNQFLRQGTPRVIPDDSGEWMGCQQVSVEGDFIEHFQRRKRRVLLINLLVHCWPLQPVNKGSRVALKHWKMLVAFLSQWRAFRVHLECHRLLFRFAAVAPYLAALIIGPKLAGCTSSVDSCQGNRIRCCRTPTLISGRDTAHCRSSNGHIPAPGAKRHGR